MNNPWGKDSLRPLTQFWSGAKPGKPSAITVGQHRTVRTYAGSVLRGEGSARSRPPRLFGTLWLILHSRPHPSPFQTGAGLTDAILGWSCQPGQAVRLPLCVDMAGVGGPLQTRPEYPVVWGRCLLCCSWQDSSQGGERGRQLSIRFTLGHPPLWYSDETPLSGSRGASRPPDNEFSTYFPASTGPGTVRT